MSTQPTARHLGFVSKSAERTRAFGEELGKMLAAGDVLLLAGPFGAGKTTLVQGLGAGLGVQGHITSPSFTLINEYGGRLPLYHVDLFRLESLGQEMEQAIEGCESGEGITVIEWPDLLPSDLRAGALRIDMEAVGEDERSLLLHLEGTRWSTEEIASLLERVIEGGSEGAA